MKKPVLDKPREVIALSLILWVCTIGILDAQTVGDHRTTGVEALADSDYFAAIEAFGRALQINPQDLDSGVGMAEAYYWLGEYDQAQVLVSRALELSHQDPAILTLSGRISIGLGDLEAARVSFDRAIAVEPNNVGAEIGLAELSLAEGRNLDAALSLERALRIRPEHRKALLSLVLVYEQAGDFETAERYLEIALETHGNAPETHILAAEYDVRRGDNESAAGHARTAQVLDAQNSSAARIRATVALLDGRYLETITTTEELLRKERTDARIWFLRGQALIAAARVEEAMDSFRTALRYEPDNEIVRLVAENAAMLEYPMEAPIRAESPCHFQASFGSLGSEHPGCSVKLGEFEHHTPDGAETNHTDALSRAKLGKLETVDRAGQRLCDGRLRVGECVRDRCHRSVPERCLIEHHPLLESTGELIADGIVDRAICPHAVPAPVACTTGHISTHRDPLTLAEARYVASCLHNFARNLVTHDGWKSHPVVPEVEYPDIGSADGTRLHLKDCLILSARRLRRFLDVDSIQGFKYRRFHRASFRNAF